MHQPPSAHRRIGSPIAPRHSTVTRLARDLAGAWRRASRTALDPHYVIALHNALAAYVQTVIQFATGLRAVIDGVPTWSMLDEDLGIMLLSDKDDPAGFSTRTVPLPGLAVQQIGHWREHCQRLPGLLAPLLGSTIWQLPQELVFYLAYDSSRGVSLRSRSDTTITDSLARALPWYKLPSNCNRHALRSRLIARRCPVEFVDAFLGHWVRGTQPWGRFSAFLPQDYLNEVRLHLDAILANYGFKSIRGAL